MNTETDTISGWELNNPDPELFDMKILEVFGACKTCPHLSECPTPSESIRELVPRKGELIQLGREQSSDGSETAYFALIHGESVRLIELQKPVYQWAKAIIVTEESIPGWVVAKLSRVQRT